MHNIQPTLFIIKPLSSVFVSTVVCQITQSIAFIIFPYTLKRKSQLGFNLLPTRTQLPTIPLLTTH